MSTVGRGIWHIRDAFREDGVSMTYNHLNVHIVDNTKEK